MEIVTCALCNCNQSTPVYELSDFWLEGENTSTSFVRCNQCGLVYQNPRPEPHEMQQYYPEKYEVFQAGLKEKRGRLHTYGLSKRSNFIIRYKQSGVLLDVGCANGVFLKWMEQLQGWQLYGVEMGEFAAETARQKGLNVITGTLESAVYQQSFFDVVTLWDVIEHVHQPVETLKEVNRIMRPDAILVMRLPNLSSIDAKIFGKYWAGFDAPRHLYAFTIPNLQKLLEQAGFIPIMMNTQVGGYLNFVKSIRFFIKNKKINSRAKKILLGLLSSWPVRIILAPVFFLKDQNLRGSEIVVVAKKQDRL